MKTGIRFFLIPVNGFSKQIIFIIIIYFIISNHTLPSTEYISSIRSWSVPIKNTKLFKKKKRRVYVDLSDLSGSSSSILNDITRITKDKIKKNRTIDINKTVDNLINNVTVPKRKTIKQELEGSRYRRHEEDLNHISLFDVIDDYQD